MFDPDLLETRDVERFAPEMMLEQEIYQKKGCEIMNVLTEAMIEEMERMNYEGVTVLLFGEDCDWEDGLFG